MLLDIKTYVFTQHFLCHSSVIYFHCNIGTVNTYLVFKKDRNPILFIQQKSSKNLKTKKNVGQKFTYSLKTVTLKIFPVLCSLKYFPLQFNSVSCLSLRYFLVLTRWSEYNFVSCFTPLQL